MHLFPHPIASWKDWSQLYQSIPSFTPLAEHILQKEGLPVAPLEHLTPGTNAVFRVGDYVLKIFAPPESGFNLTLDDLKTELFSMQRAEKLGVHAPKLIAKGMIDDKYKFAYMIMEYIEGIEFARAVKTMTDEEKFKFGRTLRSITDTMNTPCEAFNAIDVIHDKSRQWRWDKFPEQFRKERLAYIKAHEFGERVFVHGDIGGDNMILSTDGEIYVIDFADAVLAPIEYEHELIAIDVFQFDPALLHGFFGNYTINELAELCFNGVLIHDFGGDTIEEHIGKPSELHCLDDLRKRLKQKLDDKVRGAFA
ncbi:MAG: aminoglycoside phosphotransferase family protein [Oscillospiraceae bacterium]|nr:aminoglycoside phosphotransferase family protein [Oscillospiraceae bacterium]